MRRLVFLAVLIALAGWAYLRRDWIMDRLGVKHTRASESTTTANTIPWEPVSDAAAVRARTAITSLGQKRGPVFANVTAGELVSYVRDAIARQLPPSTSDVAGAVVGDRMYVRATISLDDVRLAESLGPLAGVFDKRETLVLGGTLDVVKPTLGEVRVEEARVHDLSLPRPVIAKVLRQVLRGDRPAGVAENGIPVPLPAYIGDARVSRGKITLYKSVP